MLRPPFSKESLCCGAWDKVCTAFQVLWGRRNNLPWGELVLGLPRWLTRDPGREEAEMRKAWQQQRSESSARALFPPLQGARPLRAPGQRLSSRGTRSWQDWILQALNTVPGLRR